MNTTRTASKSEAIALIKSAKKAGWKVEVEALRVGSRSIATQVTLSSNFSEGMLYVWAHVHISFRRIGSRQSVTISSLCDFEKESRKGLWSARRAVEYVNRYSARRPAVVSA